MQKGLKIKSIRALKDNYIWLVKHTELNQCIVIDPSEAAPVLSYLQAHKIDLAAILVTHKHFDHTGGIIELKKHFPFVEIYGSALESIPEKTKNLSEGSQLALFNNKLQCVVYEVPGHTKGHIAYYMPDINVVFTGDTLFSGGCGRLFEGTFSELHQSLLKLRALPATTQMYCGHEYTVANLKFASWLEPDNSIVKSALEKAQYLEERGDATLPSTLGLERRINPFLRCDEPAFIKKMQQRFGLEQATAPLSLFQYLRQKKDSWNTNNVIQ